MKYEIVIGLEVHIELNTKSKMFCSCANDSDVKEPNTNICPVCIGHPGTLPVINKKAIEKTVKTGLALNCSIGEYSRFDRKNYFYPDLPKGYQISQHEHPLCSKGYLEVNGKKVKIRRIHLEEDAGKLVHPKGADHSLVDFNRSGVPLMELVTDPDINLPTEASKIAEELREILRYLEVSNVDMEKGEMRIDANISLSSAPGKLDGKRVEVKNLNSFRSIERALEYEVERQKKILDDGGKVKQETRGWDDQKGVTIPQRSKEDSNDYRYFPDPDLPSLDLRDRSFIDLEKLRISIPELPKEKKVRLKTEYGLSDKEIDFMVRNKSLGDYYEKTVSELCNWVKESELRGSVDENQYAELSRLVANYTLTDLQSLLKGIEGGDNPINPENFAEFILMVYKGKMSSVIAKTVLKEMFETGGDPSNIIRERGLTELKDESEIEGIIDSVIDDNPKAVDDYKKGKKASVKFLVGQTMRKTGGRLDPEVIGGIIEKKLSVL